MKFYSVKKNNRFIGRKYEWERLDEIRSQKEASVIVMYGRRRVGKTELIEQYYANDKILKFEGIEMAKNDRSSAREREAFQISQCLIKLAEYAETPLMAKVSVSTWTGFFDILTDFLKEKNIVLYFEEVQWLANYESRFFAEMKPFWDNHWRHLSNFTVILCGSSTSFITKQLLADKALYGRIRAEFHLKPLNLPEISKFLSPCGPKETMLACLSVGGICEYLGFLKGKGTILTQLCRQSFTPSAFFLMEIKKIFVSHLSHHKHYQNILEVLSRKKFATIKEIAKAIGKNPKSGGSLTEIFNELENCGFIEKYTSLLGKENSKTIRFAISDEYLRWYYKFIKPLKKEIESGKFISNPVLAASLRSFETTMGFHFERWCRNNAHLFAKILGFSGVEYTSGAFFTQRTEAGAGFQIDLAYIIKGSKVVICEIKYSDEKTDSRVFNETRKKMEIFQNTMPRYKNYTFETVLITSDGLKEKNGELTFDRVVTFKEIFDERYWD